MPDAPMGGGTGRGAPPGQHHRLGAALRLAADAGHVGEVRAPLPAVHAVVPPPPHVHALPQQRLTQWGSVRQPATPSADPAASAHVDSTHLELHMLHRFGDLTVD